jgi:hypothetical protein
MSHNFSEKAKKFSPSEMRAREILYYAAKADETQPLNPSLVQRPARDKVPNPHVHIPLDPEKATQELQFALEDLLTDAGGRNLRWSDNDPYAKLLLIEPLTLPVKKPNVFAIYNALVKDENTQENKRVRMLTIPIAILEKAVKNIQKDMPKRERGKSA